MRRIVMLAAVVVVVLAAACDGDPPDAASPAGDAAERESPTSAAGSADDGGTGPERTAVALQPFDHCDALRDFVQDAATDHVGPYGIAGPARDATRRFSDVGAALEGGADRAAAAPLPAPGGATEEGPTRGVDYSGTNVQEEGVDEPDTVKTDGERLFVSVGGSLQALDVTGDEPRLLGSVPLPGGGQHELLLAGDRVFALGGGDAVVEPVPAPEPAFRELDVARPAPAAVVVAEVDVSDPGAMEIVSSEQIEGRYLTARAVDGIARIVLSTPAPQPDLVQPTGPEAEDAAETLNRELVADTDAGDWLPARLTSTADDVRRADARTPEREPLLECGDVHHPAQFSGFGTITVMTVDLSEPLDTSATTGVMADGDTVYASRDSLYVATNEWLEPEPREEQQQGQDAQPEPPEPGDYRSTIHEFDISGDGSASYTGSAAVPGHLLNQFAMSEHDGVLRVATTAGSPWGPESSESFITTFGRTESGLTQLGQVGDMGEGERIYAVRYLGDTGYVVTFRQTDPLYVVDLSDPANPTVTGELKIPGFSSYLHPVGEGRILGVGQDADLEGRTQGSQVSLFDVSDPSDPRRVDQLSFGSGDSPVEWDHRAFLWWAPERLAVLPVALYDQGDQYTGAVGLEIGDGALSERGRVNHDRGGAITRTVVVDDLLLTISPAGLGMSELDGFDRIGFVEWG